MVAPGFTYVITEAGTGDVTRTIEATPVGDGFDLVVHGVVGAGPTWPWPDRPTRGELGTSSERTRWEYGVDVGDWGNALAGTGIMDRVTAVDAVAGTTDVLSLDWETRLQLRADGGQIDFAVDPPSELNSWIYPNPAALIVRDGLLPCANETPSFGSWLPNVPRNDAFDGDNSWNHPTEGELVSVSSTAVGGDLATQSVITHDGTKVWVSAAFPSFGLRAWHGLPPEVEISGRASLIFTNDTNPSTPEVVLTLKQWYYPTSPGGGAVTPDSSAEVDRQAMTLVKTTDHGGGNYSYFWELQPTDAASVGTLDANTWRYEYEVANGYFWHKVPAPIPTFGTESHIIDPSLPEVTGFLRRIT